VPRVSGVQPWIAAGISSGVVPLAPVLPQLIHTHGHPQFQRLCLLDTNAVEGAAGAGACPSVEINGLG
jgi:hypothetical protein